MGMMQRGSSVLPEKELNMKLEDILASCLSALMAYGIGVTIGGTIGMLIISQFGTAVCFVTGLIAIIALFAAIIVHDYADYYRNEED